ncbi:hypothetical protein DB88DRAFT_509522 [Papiliotrema laurentii]|uniref:Cytochrome c oxidase subunit 8, mitochondrial n=1 Tax=Papiliotrema laurentii TaxID=5418 RepID=A0AAD9FTK2_PAPLA|nr:hypothetical protein DB88DRAFT_509522 [Papiliotrema laurentii]
MSILARSTLRVAQAAGRQQVRFASGHAEVNTIGHTLPTSVQNKPWLAAKIAIFGILGFGTPFYAVHFHLKKAGGA